MSELERPPYDSEPCSYCETGHSPASVQRTWGIEACGDETHDPAEGRALADDYITHRLEQAQGTSFAFAGLLHAAAMARSLLLHGNPLQPARSNIPPIGQRDEPAWFGVLDELDVPFSALRSEVGCAVVQPGTWSVCRDLIDGRLERTLLERPAELLAAVRERGEQVRDSIRRSETAVGAEDAQVLPGPTEPQANTLESEVLQALRNAEGRFVRDLSREAVRRLRAGLWPIESVQQAERLHKSVPPEAKGHRLLDLPSA